MISIVQYGISWDCLRIHLINVRSKGKILISKKKICSLVNEINKVIEICLAIIIALHFPVTYIKEKQLDVEEIEVQDTNLQNELYDLNTVEVFNDHIWCLNQSKNCVIVLSKEGCIEKVYYLPGIKDKGSSRMYIYHRQLCVRDKGDILYQFSSVNDYKRVLINKENKVQIFNQKGKKISEISLNKKYDEILLFLDDYCYLNNNESNEITICDQLGEVAKEIINYDKMTNYSGKKNIVSEGVTYQIRGVNNRIVKEKNENATVLAKSNIIEILFLADDMWFLMIILLLIAQFIRFLVIKHI